MVNLAKLLSMDETCVSREALPDVFGDRYLCANNELYLKIRQLFLAGGSKYSCDATRLWRDYTSFPLLMLQEFVESGVVLYKDNFTTLKGIVLKNPGLEMPAHLFLSLLQRNYLLHESAHCVSYRIVWPSFGSGSPPKDQYVVVAILCEAYANTVERLAASLATPEIHKLLYTANSFVQLPEGISDLIANSICVFGLEKVFIIGMLSFWHENIHDEVSESDLNVIIDVAFDHQTLSESKRRLLHTLIRRAFFLSKGFRGETTPLLFRYLGYEKEFRDLCRLPFHTRAISSLAIMGSIHKLVGPTCQGMLVNSIRHLAVPAEARQGSLV